LREFIRQAWPIVEPGTTYSHNWHIDAICEHLEAATAGSIRRLIINIPPRTMKSISVSVMWPAWVWLTRPETRWMFASYAQDLATEHSVNCRSIIEHPGSEFGENPTLLERVGYQGLLRLLGEDWQLEDDDNQKTKFRNTRRGYRFATSVDGRGTGMGGDFVVVDDPHNIKEAESDVRREAACRWWDRTLASRMNTPKAGVRVLVMQRVHEEDVTGHVLSKAGEAIEGEAGWWHLCLPMEYEPSHPFVWPEDPRTRAGELLWPDRLGPVEVAELRRDLGPYAAAGQLQQRPAPAEGGVIKTRWFRYFDPDGELPVFTSVLQSWDTALKDKQTSDYTVGQVWGIHLARRYLLRSVRGRWGLADTIEEVRNLSRWVQSHYPAHSAHQVLVENRANGVEVIAALQHEIPGVLPVDPNRDKVLRARAIEPQLAAGNVYLPGHGNHDGSGPDTARTPGWVQELLAECASFPFGSHDDQVDAMTQALDPARMLTPPPAGVAATGGVGAGRDPYSGSDFG
jgi:predicted phage terminase large subunit-like protein